MNKIISLINKPEAWLPLALSLIALTFLISYVSIFGIENNQDEGTPARIFQLILLTQIPVTLFFIVKWFPRDPKPAMAIFILQILVAMVPILIVIYLENQVMI